MKIPCARPLIAVVLGLALALPAAAMLPAEGLGLEAPAEQATPEPARAPIAAGSGAAGDGRIAERISGIFAEIPTLASVTAEVEEGVVTLAGTVNSADAEARAEAIAGRVEGVVTVENRIERDVSVDGGLGLGDLGERVAGLTRMLPLVAAAILVALLIAGFGYALASLTSIWRRLAPNGFLAELIASAIRFVFIVGGIVIALDIIGAGTLLGAVLGGAGVIGIALGFAMRDTIENYVASLMLSLRQPFRPNDWVLIEEHEGRVIRLTSRATILMTLDGNHLRIPNSTVFKAVILNYTRNPQRRFDFVLGIDADDDPEAAGRLGRKTLTALPWVLAEPPPEARVLEVGDSNIAIQFLGWIDQRETDWFKANSGVIARVKAALEEAGFALPEPIYRLRFDPRTRPLPVEGLAAGSGDGQVTSEKAQAAAPAAPPSPPPAAIAEPVEEEVGVTNEIARMVDDERAGEHAERDLLDPGRPVEWQRQDRQGLSGSARPVRLLDPSRPVFRRRQRICVSRRSAELCRPTTCDQRSSGGLRILGALDRFEHHLLCLAGPAPGADADPFLGLQILVMREEVLDLAEHDLGQIVLLADRGIIGKGRIDRDADQLLVAAMLVFQVEHRDRPRAHHAARDEGRARHHQRIERIAVGRQGVRHEAVIGRVAHRRVQDTINEQRARRLVELVFDRLAADRDLYQHVKAFGRIVAGGDMFDAHRWSLSAGFAPDPRAIPGAALLQCSTGGNR